MRIDLEISLSSTAFGEGQGIPAGYTCDGRDVSPPLEWGEPPPDTRSFALIADDPDAPGGVFIHWVLFNIPAGDRRLSEGIPARERLGNGALQGRTDFGTPGYGGPCPPRGPAHRYRFTIYALDRTLDLKSGISSQQLVEAMNNHILARGRLTGTYGR